MQYLQLLLTIWGKLTPEQKAEIQEQLLKLYQIVKVRLIEQQAYTQEEMTSLEAALQLDPSQIGGFGPPSVPPQPPPQPTPDPIPPPQPPPQPQPDPIPPPVPDPPPAPQIEGFYSILIYEDPFVNYAKYGFKKGDLVFWVVAMKGWVVEKDGTAAPVSGSGFEFKGRIS